MSVLYVIKTNKQKRVALCHQTLYCKYENLTSSFPLSVFHCTVGILSVTVNLYRYLTASLFSMLASEATEAKRHCSHILALYLTSFF